MTLSKILSVHNSYQQAGGEDAVVQAEWKLLKNAGHDVSLFEVSNDCIRGLASQLKVGVQVVYSFACRRKLREVLKRKRPDVVHVHNFFPLLTPSIYDACADAGVPVVQTLHNYRLLCPGGLFMRNGKICEECLEKGPFQGVRYGCYRGSRLQTLPVAMMLAIHNWRKTWHEKVNRFIALTKFAREKFIQAGFPSEKIVVKPNFVRLPKILAKQKNGKYAVFVGRLSIEKGVVTLLRAWQDLTDMPLKLIGHGPLLDKAINLSPKSVEVLGRKTHRDTISLLVKALFLILPAECYEGFPMVIAEAFACGVPVIASRLGAMAEIIDDGRTGLLFEPRNAKDLASKVRWLFEHPEKAEEMGRNARAEYEEKYTPERNYELLMDIYQQAIEEKGGKGWKARS
ncbi:MAG: glycosyltransferase family 4 protein [Deltaproteobacteria bacterium]|nr:glycosyltransferase family 4 protein [Deltaproteobacteria bacterium]